MSYRAAVVLVTLLVAVLPPAHAKAGDGPSSGGGAPAVGPAPIPYVPPAPGQVLRRFDPPEDPFGAGHRGVTLDVPVGSAVSAASGGTVTFAGPVAGVTWVVIQHPDGIRTSYGPLADVAVRVGDRIAIGGHLGRVASPAAGTSLARSWADAFDRGLTDVAPDGRGLHWGARRGDRYLDPLSLLDVGPGTPTLVGAGGWQPTDHPAVGYEPWRGGGRTGLFAAGSPRARHPYRLTAPTPHHLVVIGGLGSDSTHPPLDGTHLGYDPRSITHLSYAGRHSGSTGIADPRRDQWPYEARHTWEGVEAAAERLRDQLQAQWAREPGRAVDLVGHSMGGVVALWYLTHLHDPYDPTLPPVANVVTIASPLDGTGIATLVQEAKRHSLVGPVVGLLHAGARRVGPAAWRDAAQRLDPGAPAVTDLRRTSPVIESLRVQWYLAHQDDEGVGPLATGTRVLTVAASRDLVVPARRAVLHDAERTTLPGSHGGVLTTEALREVVHEFLVDGSAAASPGRVAGLASELLDDAYTLGGGALLYSDLTRPLRRPPRSPGPGP